MKQDRRAVKTSNTEMISEVLFKNVIANREKRCRENC